jgi:hypothetical protein
MILGHDLYFWIAVTLAAIFKVRTSERRSAINVLFTLSASIFAATISTDAVLAWLELAPETYKVPAGCVIALTGEAVMRQLTVLDSKSIDAFIRSYFSRGKS